jgi:hypothetical protein
VVEAVRIEVRHEVENAESTGDRLISSGEITSYSQLAHMARVTRARITQNMNLNHLGQDLQEHLLFLSSTVSGRAGITEGALRAMAAQVD